MPRSKQEHLTRNGLTRRRHLDGGKSIVPRLDIRDDLQSNAQRILDGRSLDELSETKIRDTAAIVVAIAKRHIHSEPPTHATKEPRT